MQYPLSTETAYHNRPLQPQTYPKNCSEASTSTSVRSNNKTVFTKAHIATAINNNWDPRKLHPQLWAATSAYIKELFTKTENCSDDKRIASAIHYVFTHSKAFSAELIASVIECLADRPDIKDTKVFSEACIAKVNGYITNVFSHPINYSKELIASAVNYNFATDAEISDDAVKNIASHALKHQSNFSNFDICITDSAGYILSNCDYYTEDVIAEAISYVASTGEIEFSDEVTRQVDKYVSNVMDNFNKFDDKTIKSAINYIGVFPPQVLTKMLGKAKTIVAENHIFSACR